MNLITQNAIVASDAIVIVAMPEYLSTLGIQWIKMSIEELIKRINNELAPFGGNFHGPSVKGIIFNRVNERSTLVHLSAMAKVQAKYSPEGIRVFQNHLSESVRIGERPEIKFPISLSGWPENQKYVEQLTSIITEFIDHVY